MSEKIAITVVVPVKNEERNLGRCLERLRRFQEVIVVDSSSTDSTQEIAKRFGARIFDFKWNGTYPKKRNWLLLNHQFSTDWILFLDADELIDEEFCERVHKETKNTLNHAYWLNYTNYFLGVPLRHGVPQRKLALLRVGAGLYERIDELSWSSLDMEVHEHPIIAGPIGEIAVPIDHDDDRGVARFIDRHREYAMWEARRWASLYSSDPHMGQPTLTDRQRFKYRSLTQWWYPGLYFCYTYLIRGGFLDGRAGFAYATLKCWYFYVIQLLIRERRVGAN